MFEFSYEKISSILPRELVNVTGKLMIQGGFKKISPRTYIGFSLFFSLCLALLAFFGVQFYTTDQIISIVLPIAVFGLMETIFYILLVATADARAAQIEEMLPPAMQIIAANIRAGMTLENAVWGAARPEFGPLRDEIQKVSADVFGGMPISNSLMRFTTRVRSNTLERAVKLLVQGISLGGEMAHLLEEVSNDIRNVQRLKREVATSTTTYAMFIVFAAVLASPLLFSVSVYYTQLNEDLFQKQVSDVKLDDNAMQQAGMSGVPMIGIGGGSSEKLINSEDVKLFALAAIALTSISAAFILGLIRFGKAAQGLFYAPLFLFISLLIFFITSALLGTALGPVFK
ncbi:MAG: type II secretion system F family protein [Candidatus Micrarchaeota archaeon]